MAAGLGLAAASSRVATSFKFTSGGRGRQASKFVEDQPHLLGEGVSLGCGRGA